MHVLKTLTIIGFTALIGAAALVGAAIHEAEIIRPIEDNPSYMNVAKSVGAVLCPKGKWLRQSGLGFADLYVGDQQQRCTQWAGVFPGIVVSATTVNLESGTRPLVVYFPLQERPGASKIVVVEIVGGPSGSISPSENSVIMPHLSNSGIPSVSLGYTGTLYESMYPKSSYQAAVKDVVEYIKKIRSLGMGSTKIILLGESLGGRIAIDAVSRMPDNMRPTLTILVNPLMLSPLAAKRNFMINFNNNPANDSFIITKSLSSAKEPWEKVGTIPLFDAFFDQKSKEDDLVKFLKIVPAVHPLIIFGTDDKVIGLNLINHLTPDLANVAKIKGMGHHPNKNEEKRIVGIIEDAISTAPDVL